jgi:hypothetical protein
VKYSHSVCVLAVLIWSAPAVAQQIYVYGPAGAEQDRRVMAVLTDHDGHCVSSDAPIEWTSSTAEVLVEERAGPCVRWLRLRPHQVGDRLVLEAVHRETRAVITVPFDDHGQLTVRATRRGRRLDVVVGGSNGGEEHHGW